MKVFLFCSVALLALSGAARAQSPAFAHTDSVPPSNTPGQFVPLSVSPLGGLRTQLQDGAGNDVSTAHPLATRPGGYAPIAATGALTLVAGGIAQAFQAAGATPVACVIVNPSTAAEQGIATAEAVWVNVVATAAASAGGTSLPVEAGSSLPVGPLTGAVSWIAATTGHKIAGYCQ